ALGRVRKSTVFADLRFSPTTSQHAPTRSFRTTRKVSPMHLRVHVRRRSTMVDGVLPGAFFAFLHEVKPEFLCHHPLDPLVLGRVNVRDFQKLDCKRMPDRLGDQGYRQGCLAPLANKQLHVWGSRVNFAFGPFPFVSLHDTRLSQTSAVSFLTEPRSTPNTPRKLVASRSYAVNGASPSSSVSKTGNTRCFGCRIAGPTRRRTSSWPDQSVAIEHQGRPASMPRLGLSKGTLIRPCLTAPSNLVVH